MRTIGLIGGIGSGKTTVAGILEELGAQVIHADLVGHEVYRPHTAGWRAVVDAFGPTIVAGDGSIDRKQLGAIVFADPSKLKQLNAIVHPLIGEEIRRRIATSRANGFTLPIVVEAAILVEAGWLPLVDEVWLVLASPRAVSERLQSQRGLPAEEIARRVRSQLSDDARRPHARVCIENTGSLDELAVQVRKAWNQSLASPD